MNTRLELLFEKYKVSAKDRYEINQIFWLLPPIKQQNILNNFSQMIYRFDEIYNEINLEREILIWNEVNNIKNIIINSRINKEKEELRKELLNLK
jgi:hypothetical protein